VCGECVCVCGECVCGECVCVCVVSVFVCVCVVCVCVCVCVCGHYRGTLITLAFLIQTKPNQYINRRYNSVQSKHYYTKCAYFLLIT
jgi:hypothetical protein